MHIDCCHVERRQLSADIGTQHHGKAACVPAVTQYALADVFLRMGAGALSKTNLTSKLQSWVP